MRLPCVVGRFLSQSRRTRGNHLRGIHAADAGDAAAPGNSVRVGEILIKNMTDNRTNADFLDRIAKVG